MIVPKNLEEIASYIEKDKKTVFFFTADWCGDCRFLKPYLAAIEEENSDFIFVEVNRDDYIDLAKTWDVFGIPSLVVIQKGQELGRLVNRNRKTKEEINQFLAEL